MVGAAFAENGISTPEHPDDVTMSKCAKFDLYGSVKDCLMCHNKDMSLTEQPIGAGTRYADDIGVDDGIKFIRVTINDMDSYVPTRLKSISDYLLWHPDIKMVKIHVRSYGGSLFDCWDAIGIINEMKSRDIIIETTAYGYAMSAGFVIFTSGSFGHRIVSETTNFMWHELRAGEWFSLKTPSKLEDEAEIFRKLQSVIHQYLVERSRGKVKKEFLDRIVDKDEWWITGIEMYENGLADKLIGAKM